MDNKCWPILWVSFWLMGRSVTFNAYRAVSGFFIFLFWIICLKLAEKENRGKDGAQLCLLWPLHVGETESSVNLLNFVGCRSSGLVQSQDLDSTWSRFMTETLTFVASDLKKKGKRETRNVELTWKRFLPVEQWVLECWAHLSHWSVIRRFIVEADFTFL